MRKKVKIQYLIVGVTLLIVFVVSILNEKGINVREKLKTKNIALRWCVWYALILFIIIFGAYGILGEPENTIDVIFIGDSESYCSFNPQQIWKEYGITSYVCGTPAQILPYTNELITQVFEKQSPKTVVLETNVIFRKSTKESAIFNKIEQQFPVFRYHDRWKSLSIDDWKLEYDYSYTNKQKGFRPKKDIVPADATEYMVYTAEKKKFPQTIQLMLIR